MNYNYYNYDYGYDYYPYNAAFSSIVTGIMVAWFFITVLVLAVNIVKIIAMWKIFKKAGKNGWEAIIPFYNMWTFFEISGYPGYFMLFGLIPCLGIIILFILKILAYISLSKKFNKGSGFVVLLVFLQVIGLSILGFGNDEYDSSLGEQKNLNPINEPEKEEKEENETKDNKKKEIVKSNKSKYCGNCGKKINEDAVACPNCGNKLK